MLMGMFLVSFVILVALVTVLSGIGVGEHCGAGSGGVYSMISSVLGGQTGGTIGLLYVFGQVSLGCQGPAAVPGGHLPLPCHWPLSSLPLSLLAQGGGGGGSRCFYRWAAWVSARAPGPVLLPLLQLPHLVESRFDPQGRAWAGTVLATLVCLGGE